MSGTGEFVLSVDVEDWPQSTWDRALPITPRAARNTEVLLDLLAARHARVTMFVLGKFAEEFPDIVRRIDREGHEIASHGHGHVEIFRQSREEFRDDVTRSKAFLEDTIGKPVLGYRAPDFSIIRSSLWALEVLAETGFAYDSSIFPIAHSRYGVPDWPIAPVSVRLPSGRSIVELPIATLDFRFRRVPVAGGGYHRLLPGPAIRAAVDAVRKAGRPFMAYCHPYEIDPAEFRETGLKIPLGTRLHQGIGRSGFRRKLSMLVEHCPPVQARVVALGRAWPPIVLSELPAGGAMVAEGKDNNETHSIGRMNQEGT